MLTLRRAQERGKADHGWLRSAMSFSFADYHDARHMGFGNLRVINEDHIAAGTGFGTHGHRDMEIISYVLSGELAHQDSMGNRATMVPGDVQRMSAGRGVMHSEYNQNPTGDTHFLQIWLLPHTLGVSPSYEQKHFPVDSKRGQLRLVAAPDGAQGAVALNADARLYAGLFDAGEAAQLTLAPGRKAYVHLVRGRLDVNGQSLQMGDAALLDGETSVLLNQGHGAEVLVFDLAP
jgi:quercetin 2,3-dioxygenase